MHNSYVNDEDCRTKALSTSMNVLVNWKGGERPPVHQYESSKGIYMTNKYNPGRFKRD